MKVNIDWSGDMAFKAGVNGFTLNLDADEKVGGKNTGPRPKPLLLVALGGCTGMDVISILGKMRVVPDHFDIEIDAEQTEEHPKYYHKIHIKYLFRGKDLPIVVLTALDGEDSRRRGIAAGADAYFPKPFDPDEVIGTLRGLLEDGSGVGGDD